MAAHLTFRQPPAIAPEAVDHEAMELRLAAAAAENEYNGRRRPAPSVASTFGHPRLQHSSDGPFPASGRVATALDGFGAVTQGSVPTAALCG